MQKQQDMSGLNRDPGIPAPQSDALVAVQHRQQELQARIDQRVVELQARQAMFGQVFSQALANPTQVVQCAFKALDEDVNEVHIVEYVEWEYE